MAMVPNRGAKMVRRATACALGADVVVALILGLIVGSLVGWIVFVLGLVITGLMYFNFRQAMRVRGMR
jgi:hypothetical protein